ncbi:hypothetical protein QBC35DRAFT_505997 [Podospora australis]|uniref:Uncharacterized protein n=1 Tax=Podospora australis TaxID=1536484 RepID=A0AAN6WQC0_9PEZI|nr:hypothetical protein QBC35DRAFT_505997 [Podospora australis]
MRYSTTVIAVATLFFAATGNAASSGNQARDGDAAMFRRGQGEPNHGRLGVRASQPDRVIPLKRDQFGLPDGMSLADVHNRRVRIDDEGNIVPALPERRMARRSGGHLHRRLRYNMYTNPPPVEISEPQSGGSQGQGESSDRDPGNGPYDAPPEPPVPAPPYQGGSGNANGGSYWFALNAV